jgi:hypothetical protein
VNGASAAQAPPSTTNMIARTRLRQLIIVVVFGQACEVMAHYEASRAPRHGKQPHRPPITDPPMISGFGQGFWRFEWAS